MVWDTSVWPRGEMILMNLTRLLALKPMKIKTYNFILILLLRLKGRITIKVSVQNCLTMCKLQLCKGGDNFPLKNNSLSSIIKPLLFRVQNRCHLTISPIATILPQISNQ